jgi:DNA-binding Lrp family transcriptional regulator
MLIKSFCVTEAMELDEKDLMLISELRANSRKSIALISRDTKIPVSTIFDRIARLEGPVIKKYSALIDFSKMGYGIKVGYMIKGSEQKKEELRNFLMRHPCTNTIFRINNGFDFYAELVFSGICQMEEFQESLKSEGAVAAEPHCIISEIKRECFLSNE